MKTTASLVNASSVIQRLFLLFCFAVAIFLVQQPSATRAQGAFSGILSGDTTKDPAALDKLIGEARDKGSTIVVISPAGQQTEAKPGAMPMRSEDLLRTRERIKELFSHIPEFWPEVTRVLTEASADGTVNWLLIGVLTAVVGLLLGWWLYRKITGFLAEHFRATRENPSLERSQKIGFLLARAGLLLLSSGLMFGIAILVALIFDTGYEPTRRTIFTLVAGYASYRVLRYVIFFNIFVPDTPNLRLINLEDDRARVVYRDWYWTIAVAVILISICEWLRGLGLNDDAYALCFIGTSAVIALLLAFMTFNHRRDLVEIVRGDTRGKQRRWLTLAGKILIPVMLLYLAIAWLVSSIRLALGLPGAHVLIAAPIIIFIVAIFAYGFAILVLEWTYQYRASRFRRDRVLRNLRASRQARRRAALASLPAEVVGGGEDDGDDGEMPDHEEMIVHQEKPKEDPNAEYKPMFKDFFEKAIASLVLIVCVGELARLWGVDMGREGGHPLARALDIVLVVLVTGFLIQAFNRFIDAKIIEEGGSLDDSPANPGEGDSEGGTGESRLATLLPIVRRAIVFTLVVVMVTMALSAMGVNVAPLFAGAGVVGLAIGFGAQTLIRDIFSGLFFLIDDAFRKGEYIEVGNVKGVIEKISVRSFQLRHHLGAVHTVPFGEITQLTNYSRDWVMMKLPLRLTYDTDVEKVRKLVKKLGQRLLEDPVVGPLFLQALKSQGVYKMEDSAMIIRVKFMTRPGDQFVTRKVVYAAIRELFEQEGIKFAHREVTVRLADGKNADTLTDAEREAVAGSVQAAILADEEGVTKAPAGGDR